MAGCGQAARPTGADRVAEQPLEYRQDISHPVYLLHKDAFSLKISAANLAIRGWEAGSRAILESPRLQVVDAKGDDLLLTAQSAIALHPWSEMNWMGYSLETADATTFEGDELMWPYRGRKEQVALLGPTLVITQTVMLEGDTVVGDLLLRGYEILHVLSAIAIDSTQDRSRIPDARE